MSHLSREEVLEVVALYHEGWGVRNIARKLELLERRVEKILNGTSYTQHTGGRIMKGNRPTSELAIYR